MNFKKISLFLIIAFAISWSVAVFMHLFGVAYGSLASTALIGALYMPGPAFATLIVQKLIYKEGVAVYGWKFKKENIRWILYTILLFLGLLLLAFLCSALLGNSEAVPQFGRVDFSQANFDLQFKKMLSEKMDLSKIKIPSIPPAVFLVISILQGIIAGATLNLPFMFGEEFGWRGLLLSETKSMGFIKSNLFIGIVWGLWHLPIIMMGHNYPHHPHFGILMMCVMTTALAPLFAYVRIKTKTIFGPCFLHGMINGTAALFAIYIANGDEIYSGLAGWAGVIAAGLLTLGIFLFDKKFIATYSSFETEVNSN